MKSILLFLLVACANAQGSMQNITVNGTNRQYLVFVPQSAPTGLIVYVAPDASGSALSYICPSIAENVQASTGAVVVCPAAQGKAGCWKAFDNFGYCAPRGAHEDSSDVDFIAAMIVEIKEQHKVPEGRTIMSGFSNGGSMAYRFACERSDLYDGLVVESQAYFDPWVGYYDYVNKRKPTGVPQCKPQHKRPLYTVVGTVDPYYGDHPAFAGAQAAVNWENYSTQVLGCSGAKEETSQGPHTFPLGNGTTTCYKYPSCPDISPAGLNILCVVPGMGHTGGPLPMLLDHAFADFFGVAPRPTPPPTDYLCYQGSCLEAPGKGTMDKDTCQTSCSKPSPSPPSPSQGDYVCYQGQCYEKPGSGTMDKDACNKTCSKSFLGDVVV